MGCFADLCFCFWLLLLPPQTSLSALHQRSKAVDSEVTFALQQIKQQAMESTAVQVRCQLRMLSNIHPSQQAPSDIILAQPT